MMITERELFFKNLAQTSDFPMMLHVKSAENIYLYDDQDRKYMDLISGIAVSNTGHRHPNIVRAIKDQADNHLHAMVYGEFIQSPQVRYASMLLNNLPEAFKSVYFVNSGSEAIEGAMKLAKRYTGRHEIIAFKNAYHGSTQGALSIIGSEYFKNPFRPLLPGIKMLRFNHFEDIPQITDKTACVVMEPIQAEAGVILPQPGFLEAVRQQCDKTGTILVFDEAQTGFGRTGSLFALQKYNVMPDVLTLAKSMGGGMPLGAFIAGDTIMNCLKENPVLGHITTFGGHPVSCAAGMAGLEVIIEEKLVEKVEKKGRLFRKYLEQSSVKEVRGTGLLFALQLESKEQAKRLIRAALKNGIVVDWFLFNPASIRIAPPLIITENQIQEAAEGLIRCVQETIEE